MTSLYSEAKQGWTDLNLSVVLANVIEERDSEQENYELRYVLLFHKLQQVLPLNDSEPKAQFQAQTHTRQYCIPHRSNKTKFCYYNFFISILSIVSPILAQSMSSGLYSFGTSNLHTHSNSDNMVPSSDGGGGDLLVFSDPFPFYSTQQNSNINQNPFDHEEALPSLDTSFSPSLFSFSPPSTHLESLSLYHQTQGNPVSNGPNLESDHFGSLSSAFVGGSEVKSEECVIDYYSHNHQHFLPHSYTCGAENISKYMMQRSFSSNSFEGKPGNFLFQPAHCETLMDSPIFQRNDSTSSPENGASFAGQMRRVCSTGDLQNMKASHTSPTEGSLMEEPNFKVGRYSAEERREKISKYRAKRSQRNFNKTIKYACRKTLADSRPRIRGRFARNDDANEIPKAACSIRDEDEDDFWIEGLRLHEEQENNVTVGAEQYLNNRYGASQFQYCGF